MFGPKTNPGATPKTPSNASLPQASEPLSDSQLKFEEDLQEVFRATGHSTLDFLCNALQVFQAMQKQGGHRLEEAIVKVQMGIDVQIYRNMPDRSAVREGLALDPTSGNTAPALRGKLAAVEVALQEVIIQNRRYAESFGDRIDSARGMELLEALRRIVEGTNR